MFFSLLCLNKWALPRAKYCYMCYPSLVPLNTSQLFFLYFITKEQNDLPSCQPNCLFPWGTQPESLFSLRKHLFAFLDFLHFEWMENVTSYDSKYALLPEYLFHVYLNNFTYDWELKTKPSPQKETTRGKHACTYKERVVHATHIPLLTHIFFSCFLRVYVPE